MTKATLYNTGERRAYLVNEQLLNHKEKSTTESLSHIEIVEDLKQILLKGQNRLDLQMPHE